MDSKNKGKHKGSKLSNMIMRESILSTDTIIKALGSIPRYDDLRHKDLTKRIINPIERLLNEIKEEGIFLGWEYCGEKGAPLPDDKLDPKTWSIFKKLYVKVTFPPPQSDVLVKPDNPPLALCHQSSIPARGH
jgi:hypothetical protein